MARGRLITVGSFDGVHRGHQALLKMAVQEAKRRHLRSLALTFDVPPKMVLDKNHVTALLSTADEKIDLIRAQGIDEVKVLKFDKRLSHCPPFSFFRSILLREFKGKGLVVGFDFRFGLRRSGGARDLVDWGLDYEIPVWVVPPVRWKGTVVSSTLLRTLLQEGKFNRAIDLLGHPFLIKGKVVTGQKLGRKIGFPTANIQTGGGKVLPRGVFAVRGRVLGRGPFKAVANIGTRPTVAKKASLTVEAHVLSGTVPRTGQTVSLELLKRLRNEKRFSSLDMLKKAISQDIRQARQWLKSH